MLMGSSTCIVLYVFVCRFSNARGFLDMYCIVLHCMCLSVGSRMLVGSSTCIVLYCVVCVCL